MEQELINTIQNKFHHLAQYLAAFSNSFLSKREDDSQSALCWSVENSALLSQKIDTIYLELNYKDIVIRIHKGDTFKELDLLGLTHSGIDSWIRETISDFGLSAGDYHYNLGFKINTEFDTFITLDAEDEKIIYQLIEARNISQRSLEHIKKLHKDTSSIYVWPHHFDTGMLVNVNSNSGYSLGHAIADNTVNKLPYYYAKAWSDNTIDYTQLPALNRGKWVLGEWNGAIVSIDEQYDLNTVENLYENFIEIIKDRL
ncbi:hypothetical protein JM658_13805 [Joostella atrarenae]|uniref:Uncharacterized protein n=1 Tax=Joostella atrarenae TaxID=679257 RepID=A0ABS9J638_9FLAO|nr:hypothetical protein [Joostella atrarenae]MCF8715906.1 hypothetical protein [Joostella atrarenae]